MKTAYECVLFVSTLLTYIESTYYNYMQSEQILGYIINIPSSNTLDLKFDKAECNH